jgi:DNA polymerase III subunit delta
MAQLKPAYLVHGDDHGAIAERRSALRALAEGDSQGSVELLEGDAATPARVAHALATMTLTPGRRVIVVEGAERWRAAEFERDLAAALRDLPPNTTLALFAREDVRVKVPDAVAKAVRAAGGQIVAQQQVKPWQLPEWVRERAARLGLSLDKAASHALVRQVGERPQRLARELEKLALEADAPQPGAAPGAAPGEREPEREPDEPVTVTAEHVEARAAHSAQWRAFSLADALVAGDVARATACYMAVREQGESLSGLIYLMAKRVREALAVSLRMSRGESAAQVKRSLRMPQRAAERFIADVSRSDPDRLRRALVELAELELDSRGGAPLLAGRSPLAPLDEDTIALQRIAAVAG